MSRKWVINASPLIVLTKISQVDILHQMCSEIVIPSGVVQEINSGPENDPARIWIRDKGKSWVREFSQIDPLVAAWDIGLGESQVLSWAYNHPDYEAILDDRAAKNAALSLGIPVRGTLGVILLAKQEGRLLQIKPILEELVAVGFRVSPQVLQAVLQLSNEDS